MFYQAKFKIDSYVNGGTLLKAFIPGVAISNKYFINDIANGEIRIDDGRKISSAQRGLLYALFTDIHSQLEGWKESRYSKDDIKELLKAKFCVKYGLEHFSLSDVSMEMAGEFINFVLEFACEHQVRLKFKNFEVAKSIRDMSYICFKNRVCLCCGRLNAVVHHIQTVGMGRNRNKVDHSKMLLIMLCPFHHSEIHNIGNESFCNKYHVAGIFVDVATLKALNIKGEYGEEANV